MNTLIYYSFNILILTLVIFGVGMFKPKWILFWMDKPSRMPIAFITAILIMIAAVMFGEGNKQLQQENAQQNKPQSTRSYDTEVPDLH